MPKVQSPQPPDEPHSSPVKPLVHWQLKPLPATAQVPPLAQGFTRHGSTQSATLLLLASTSATPHPLCTVRRNCTRQRSTHKRQYGETGQSQTGRPDEACMQASKHTTGRHLHWYCTCCPHRTTTSTTTSQRLTPKTYQAPGAVLRGSLGHRSVPGHGEASATPQPQAPGAVLAGSAGQLSRQSGVWSRSESVSGNAPVANAVVVKGAWWWQGGGV